MPDWFDPTTTSSADLSAGALVLRLVAAVLLGFVIAAAYIRAQERPAREVIPLLMTLVLLTVLVAMTTLVIDNSVARAFSLVGALAIVRFRTVVEDTRDTTFVIFAVVTGMAVGAHNFRVCLVGVPIVALTAWAMSAWGRTIAAAPAAERRLEVRIGNGFDPETLLSEVFERHLSSHRLTAATTARQGSALDLCYLIRLRPERGPLPLVQDLNRLDGVQNVELVDI